MRFEKAWKPQVPELAPLFAAASFAGAAVNRVGAPLRGALPGSPGTGSGEPSNPFGHRWFEAGHRSHAELCFSFPASRLWDFVDRRRLEALLSGPPDERKPHIEGLCAVLTAFWYFHGRHELAPADAG